MFINQYLFLYISKPTDVVKIDFFKKDVYNAKIKNIENEIPDITNLATNTTLNAKTNEIKNKMPSITNSATIAALATVENKIPNVSNTQEFNKLTSESFVARLKQANLASKTDITNLKKRQVLIIDQ